MRPLARRILTAVLLAPMAVALVLWAPPWLLFLGFLPFAYFALWEYLELAGRIGPTPARIPAYLSGAGLIALGWLAPDRLLPALIVSGLLVAVYESFLRPLHYEVLPVSSVSFLGLVYVAVPFALALELRAENSGAGFLLLVLVLIWLGDIAAFVVGKGLGRHKLAPAISPGKTVEGTLGSLVLGTVAGYGLLRAYFPQFGEVHALVFPVVINLVAQFGDLAESALKRGAGVKDSSNLLPGHGGMLDRLDGMLFAIPAAWYYWSWIS